MKPQAKAEFPGGPAMAAMLGGMFQSIADRQPRPPETRAITTIQAAVYGLRTYAGYSLSEFGERMLLGVHGVVSLERHGKPYPKPVAQRLFTLSQEFGLDELAEFFKDRYWSKEARRGGKLSRAEQKR